MQFRTEVKEQFRKAGWFPGRDVRIKMDKVPDFAALPGFLKEFLYEYGDLEVPCLDPARVGVTGILNLKALTAGYYKIKEYRTTKRSYGNDLSTFPFADYHLDASAVECAADGKVYMSGDAPSLIADTLQEGIERIVMEDYSQIRIWHPRKKEWIDNEDY